MLSLTCVFVVCNEVVVPLTVRLPVTVRSLEKVAACATVKAVFSAWTRLAPALSKTLKKPPAPIWMLDSTSDKLSLSAALGAAGFLLPEDGTATILL